VCVHDNARKIVREGPRASVTDSFTQLQISFLSFVDEAVAAVRIDQEFSSAQCIIYELLNHLPVRHTLQLSI
jgi:hypothetical protein